MAQYVFLPILFTFILFLFLLYYTFPTIIMCNNELWTIIIPKINKKSINNIKKILFQFHHFHQ